MLINLFEEWGFVYYGSKDGESVYVRDFKQNFNINNPKLTYPFISENSNIFLVPIYYNRKDEITKPRQRKNKNEK